MASRTEFFDAVKQYVSDVLASMPAKSVVFARMAVNRSLETGVKQSRAVCGEGCFHCCVLPPAVMEWEARAIQSYMHARWTEADRTAWRERALKVQEKRRSGGPVFCPFLRDGRCSIYEARPTICAGYHSFDVSDCRKGATKRGFRAYVEHPVDMGVMAVMGQFMEEVCAMFGQQPKEADMLDALLSRWVTQVSSR